MTQNLHQMEASAKQMAELEEQLVHEQSRKTNFESKLEREGERRETLQEELDKIKQVSIFHLLRFALLDTKRGTRPALRFTTTVFLSVGCSNGNADNRLARLSDRTVNNHWPSLVSTV